MVMEDEMEVLEADPGLVLGILRQNSWGHDDGRSTLVVAGERPNLKKAMEELGRDGRVLLKEEVDVKDIVSIRYGFWLSNMGFISLTLFKQLEMGRIVIEREALLWFQQEHGTAI